MWPIYDEKWLTASIELAVEDAYGVAFMPACSTRLWW